MDDIEESGYAVIYCRVSTQLQKNEGTSIDFQIKECEKWCYRNDIKVKGLYKDEAKTGTKIEERFNPTLELEKKNLLDPSNYKFGVDDPEFKDENALAKIEGISHRPDFKQCLKSCKQGDVFVCYSLTRLARNVQIALQVFSYLKEKKVFIFSVKDGLDSRARSSKLQFQMLSVFAELEADLIRDRVQSAMNEKREKNEFVGAVPFGWMLSNGPSSDLIMNNEEQKVIQLMQQFRNHKDFKGRPMSYDLVANELNVMGHTTRKGKKWNASQVQRILKRGVPSRIKGSSTKKNKNNDST